MSNCTQVITVDAAGTLIRPWPSVGAVYAKTARSFGLTSRTRRWTKGSTKYSDESKKTHDYFG